MQRSVGPEPEVRRCAHDGFSRAIVQRDHHDEWTAMREQRAPWETNLLGGLDQACRMVARYCPEQVRRRCQNVSPTELLSID